MKNIIFIGTIGIGIAFAIGIFYNMVDHPIGAGILFGIGLHIMTLLWKQDRKNEIKKAICEHEKEKSRY